MLGKLSLRKPFVLAKSFLLVLLLLQGTSSASSTGGLEGKNLTDQDKSEIIKAVLEQELKDQESPELKNSTLPRGFREDLGDQYLSTENLDFFRMPDNLAQRFKLIGPDEIRNRKLNRELFQCFLFKEFIEEGEKVLVKVTVIFTQYFFGGYMEGKRELNYEYRKVSGQWQGKSIKN